MTHMLFLTLNIHKNYGIHTVKNANGTSIVKFTVLLQEFYKKKLECTFTNPRLVQTEERKKLIRILKCMH